MLYIFLVFLPFNSYFIYRRRRATFVSSETCFNNIDTLFSSVHLITINNIVNNNKTTHLKHTRQQYIKHFCRIIFVFFFFFVLCRMTFTAAVRYSGGLCVYNFAGNIFVVLMFAFDVRACVYVCIGIEHSILSRIMYFFRLSFAFFGVERSNDTLLLCRIFSLVSSEKRERKTGSAREIKRDRARENRKNMSMDSLCSVCRM